MLPRGGTAVFLAKSDLGPSRSDFTGRCDPLLYPMRTALFSGKLARTAQAGQQEKHTYQE